MDGEDAWGDLSSHYSSNYASILSPQAAADKVKTSRHAKPRDAIFDKKQLDEIVLIPGIMEKKKKSKSKKRQRGDGDAAAALPSPQADDHDAAIKPPSDSQRTMPGVEGGVADEAKVVEGKRERKKAKRAKKGLDEPNQAPLPEGLDQEGYDLSAELRLKQPPSTSHDVADGHHHDESKVTMRAPSEAGGRPKPKPNKRNKFKTLSLTSEEDRAQVDVSAPEASKIPIVDVKDSAPTDASLKRKNKLPQQAKPLPTPGSDLKEPKSNPPSSDKTSLVPADAKPPALPTKPPSATATKPPRPPSKPLPSSQGRGGSSLIEKMQAKLQGGRFRALNEALYTQTGSAALSMMSDDPQLFERYHEGFHQQTLSWPKQPIEVAIKWIKGLPSNMVVADFGCGEAALSKSVKQKVHSFDLVSNQPEVVACNMSSVPLPDSSVDVAVFSLALMGTDYGSFLVEARRVLKAKGWLWIAEVRSRFGGEEGKGEDFKPFIGCVSKLGFEQVDQDATDRMFVVWKFRKGDGEGQSEGGHLKWPKLKACQYKRR